MRSAPATPAWRNLLPFLLAAGLAVAAGAALWFFCDDAFITFRYVGNLHDGAGLVWNPAPWAPVEGYSTFLWVVVLWALWAATGLPPTATAIPVTMSCGILILWAVGVRLRELDARRPERALGPWLQALVLLGIAGNHTFATWLSSGMETMLFALWAVLWTLEAMPAGDRAPRLFRLALWAALGSLVRPDGALLVLATAAVAAHGWLAARRSLRASAVGLLPLLLPVAHVLWRRAYYGEWLPNTYYAKVTAAWPASGLRYLGCFVVEHGVWLWAPLALAWIAVAACRSGALRALAGPRFAAFTAVSVWCGYVGYYTLVVGGDHFAFRVFAHLVPLLLLAAAAIARDLLPRALRWGWLALSCVAADAPGWWMERALVGREPDGFVRAAPTLPGLLQPVAVVYDRWQAWLHVHSVGFRRATHAFFCNAARTELPDRTPGQIAGASPGQRLVYRADAVGVVGWALADVAIVDGHGLNDWVVARNVAPPPPPAIDPAVLRASFGTFDRDGDRRLSPAELAAVSHLLVSIGPTLRPEVWADVLLSLGDDDGDGHLAADELALALQQMLPARQMAHEREPPAGYIEALRCNVADVGGRKTVRPDVVPLTDDELRDVERRFRAMVAR